MKINKLIITAPYGLIALLTAFLLIFLVSDPNSVIARSLGANIPIIPALPNQSIDACDLIPPGGEISTREETTCVAQYGSNPGEKFVQINTLRQNAGETSWLCSTLLEPNDFRVFMKEVNFGDCGIQSEIAYLGEPAYGYTGWEIHYYYQGISVRVATKQDYPANQNWIYDTAEVIEQIIQNYLDIPTSPETADELPDWIKNGQVYINKRGNEIQVPDWLDWIKPKSVTEPIKGVIKPIEGQIWIYSTALEKWRGPAKAGDFLHSGDIVIAGDNSNAQIYIKGIGWLDTIHIADNASLSFPLPEQETDYPTLWYLYSGMIKAKRTLTGEPLSTSYPPFLVSDFSAIVGARSEFVFSHDPETKTSTIYLIEGEIDYYNMVAAGTDDGLITTGQKLVVKGDGTETVLPFDETELEAVLAANNLKDTKILDQEEIEQLFSGNNNGRNEGPPRNWIIILAVLGTMTCFVTILVIAAVIVFLVIKSRKKNVAGE